MIATIIGKTKMIADSSDLNFLFQVTYFLMCRDMYTKLIEEPNPDESEGMTRIYKSLLSFVLDRLGKYLEISDIPTYKDMEDDLSESNAEKYKTALEFLHNKTYEITKFRCGGKVVNILVH